MRKVFSGQVFVGDRFDQEAGVPMRTERTSKSSPLQIAAIPVEPDGGCLGLTICPGKKDLSAGWNRDLATDLDQIQAWGASIVVALIENHEFRLLAVNSLGRAVQDRAMAWMHLPIRDVSVPDQRFEETWKTKGKELHRRLDAGERILIHCRGGLGRTGLVAACLLVERGFPANAAIRQVRLARPHAIETPTQEAYVERIANGLV